MSTFSHYNKTIRKINAAFASLFNNIILIREDAQNKEDQRFIVPIEYGEKEKYIKRLQGDPDLTKKIQIVLPRMSYEMTGFKYDPERKLLSSNRNFSAGGTDPDKILSVFNPVPYDFQFSLTIYTRTVEDGNQIIEQILPYFTPDYTLRLNLIPEMGIIKSVPIVLNGVEQTIDSDGEFYTEVRTVIWTLNFNVKAFIFGAVKDVPIIKTSILNGIAKSYTEDFDGVCCAGELSKSFIVSENYGEYRRNEVVYQGQNLETAYFSGRVADWSNTSNTIIVSQICGKPKLNQPLIGIDSLAIHIPLAPAANNYISLRMVATVSPNTANSTSYYQPNINIYENN